MTSRPHSPPSIVAVIPARMASTRFPGKPLALIAGLPMIEHVRRRVQLCRDLDQVIVATCDAEIKAVVEREGGRVVMTSDAHERCTDRIAEAARQIQADIVVNVQGDEPLIRPGMIEDVISPLRADPALDCANLMMRITDPREFDDPNVVKVVFNEAGDLLFASREPIPSRRKAPSEDFPKWKQLGIIAFRSDFLKTFSRLSPTPLEQIESVDMMRAVEHGHRVRMVETRGTMIGVDVPEAVPAVETLLAGDPLLAQYAQR